MYIRLCLIFVSTFLFISCKESIAVTDKSARKAELSNSKYIDPENLQEKENFKLLSETSELRFLEIINSNLKSKSSPQNIVLLSDSINTVNGTWNHINTVNEEWNGVTKPASNYAVNKQSAVFSNSNFKGPVFSCILVKKYGDWEHQHANGYVIKPLKNNIPVGSINKIFLDLYYDSELSSIPDFDKIKSVYGHLLSDEQIKNWDNGLFNLDIQISTQNKNTLAINVTLKREMADKWLRIEVPLKNMESWNTENKPIEFKDITTDTIQAIYLTAETKSRLVYRNLDTKNFNIETTPKLFKEIAFSIKRFELEKNNF
ncbi:hypothetical protein SAMN05443549_105275 [Flavobacterium fluvii]|uniref:Uncharacterized protein n=1 Tax=Flavobacterium fluvii TaxID=468056 RepID=A0A1M5LND4_9FLAO|nr:hypothetical protein [Flavobacterium fluvii]SHG66476.1 hypothetical protein SAMN05443549_105275 [Flavobacterium fluvii]